MVRLCQMFRGWTVEYAENLIENRPDMVTRIFQVNEAQIKTDVVLKERHVYWP